MTTSSDQFDKAAKTHYDEHGYVVIRDVFGDDERQRMLAGLM